MKPWRSSDQRQSLDFISPAWRGAARPFAEQVNMFEAAPEALIQLLLAL